MSSRSTPPTASQTLAAAARWAATPAGLATLFVTGFLLRVLLGRGGGFPSDIAVFQGWAGRVAEVGPGAFYSPEVFADYPPGYLYVLWPFGELARLMFDGVVPVFLVKLPAMLADVGLAYVVMRLATIVAAAAGAERWWTRPVAAAAVLFNPPIVFLSAVWGQVDSVAAFYALAGVLLLVKPDRSTRSEAGGAALLALAFATKPQTAFLLPVVALVLLVRHVRGRPVAAGDLAVRIGTPLLAFLVTWLVLGIPFGLTPLKLVEFYGDAGSTYPYTSVWAFNLWGAIGFWRADTGVDAFRVLGVAAVSAGVVAFFAALAYVLVRTFRALSGRRPDAVVMLAGGAAVVCLSFALLTRIHERYLFLGLACLAPLVVFPQIRAAFAALSALYMLNLWFPWVYYVEEAGRHTLNVRWLYDFVYGTTQDSVQKKLLSVATAAICVLLAARIWDLFKASRASAPVPARVRPGAGPWKLGLHPIGRRGAALAGVVFLVVVPTRLIGLSSPQEMYFDEIYHARTAGEYLADRDAYEFTHPPLGKELMALSIATLGKWGVDEGGAPPTGLTTGYVDSDGTSAAWAAPSPSDGGGVLFTATPAKGCSFEQTSPGIPLNLEPAAVAVAPSGALVAGAGGRRSFVARYTGGAEQWRTPVDEPVVALAASGEVAFVVDEDGTLSRVDAVGATALAEGASDVVADPALGGVWAAFPEQRLVAAYDAQGANVANVSTQEGVDDLLMVPESDRVVAFDREARLIETIDNQGKVAERTLEVRGDLLAATPYQGFVYVVDGRDVEVVEPRALAVIGEAELPDEPAALVPVTASGALMVVGDDGLSCLTGNAYFAWRLPGALLGALTPALVFLLALRLSGRPLVAALAAAFMALDGLGFAMSRIATLDAQVTAQITGAWLAAASVYFHAHAVANGDRRGRKRLGLVWLVATGVFLGLAMATKWSGVHSFGVIATGMIADLLVRDKKGLGALFPGLPVAIPALVAAVVVLPLGIYLLSYVPYMSLGNSLGDVARLQKSMFDYHNELRADHPYSSRWHGWPFGHKAVAMWTGASGAETGAISAIANPVVFVGGLIALGVVALRAWTHRALALLLLPAAALVQYVPWIVIDRAAFLYHYLPVVPLLAVALGVALLGRAPVNRRMLYEAGAVLAAAALAFALTLPELDGWYTSPGYHESLHGWFPWLF